MSGLPEIECDGSSTCPAVDHVDGCYAAALQARWCDEHGQPGLTCTYCSAGNADFRERPGDQPLPTPNDRPSIQSLMRADIDAREQLGIRRYGTALQPHNGRDMLRDAYEEALDLSTYLRGAIEERDNPEADQSTSSGPGRVDRPGNQLEFRVGGKQPGNLYRNDKRWGFTILDEDGPLAVAALNAYTSRSEATIAELREQIGGALREVGNLISIGTDGHVGYRLTRAVEAVLAVVSPLLAARDAALGRSQASLKLIAGRYKEEIDWRLKAEHDRDAARSALEEARLELAGVEGERDSADDTLDLIRKAFGFKADEVEGWVTLALREIRRWRPVAQEAPPPRRLRTCLPAMTASASERRCIP